MSLHRSIVLGIDVVKINGIPFLSTISRAIKPSSATELPNCKTDSIMAALPVIVDMYKSREFTILAIVTDYAFEAIRNNKEFIAMGITLNTTSEDEHEPFIERFNEFLNER